MPTLRERQLAFRAAILDGGEAMVADDIVADGLDAAARLAVYRHHVLTSLTAALEATYPVVCRLVDPRFFRYAADVFVRVEPPASPCLFEYGAAFADFLAEFPPCRGLAYLPDVARLEWAMNVALHAPDAPPAAHVADTLAALPGDVLAGRVLRLHPSVTVMRSPWPVDRIWRGHQAGADPDATIDLDAGGVSLQVWRLDDDVVFRALTPAAFAFLEALANTMTLAAAAEAALAAEPATDLVSLVREALDEQALVAESLRPRERCAR